MAVNIENLDNRPWIPHHIPNQIRAELYRRTLAYGLKYIDPSTGFYDNANTWKTYRGPLTAWTRVVSNGTGVTKNLIGSSGMSAQEFENQKRNGFVLYGGQGFHDAFGNINFKNITNPYTTNILGYDVNGLPHFLDLNTATPDLVSLKQSPSRNVPVLMPPPGIVSSEANTQKERIRKVIVNWKCHSFAQLEYMTPYFFTPGISMTVEFGWNLFNINSLLDLTDESELTSLFKDGTPLYTKILESNGLYDVTFGIVTNFEFGTQDGITYDCKTEIFSKHRNHTGALMNEAPQTTVEKYTREIITKPSLSEFCKQRLKNVTKCLEGEGKNFFDALTENESKKEGYNNTELKKHFFAGKNENRIFIARNKIKEDPANVYKEPDKEMDWDSSSPDDVWVTMGFVVDLVNLFIGQKITTLKASDNPTFDLFTFDIDNVIIGGHPNLISTEGYKVLIPNPMAPKFNLGTTFWKQDYVNKDFATNKLQKQTSFKSAASFEKASQHMLPWNNQLYHVFKTGYGIAQNSDALHNLGAYRNNLDTHINRFRYNFGGSTNKSIKSSKLNDGDAAFPQIKSYTGQGNNYKPGYWGYLKDIFVHVDVIIEAATNAHTAEDFLTSILKDISGATAGFWELAIVEDENKLKIIDKKLISRNVYQNLYQFDLSSDSCIKGFSFTANPSNAQMTQVLAGSNNNQGSQTGQVTATALPDFKFGDRLGFNQIEPEKQKSYLNESSDLIKQLQKHGKVDGAFAVSLIGKSIDDYYEVLNLVLPSKHLLLTLLNCVDVEDNLNIYGGQQPNFTIELVLQGISGLRTFQCFSMKNLPKPYSPDEVIFQIIDISHVVQNGDWTTIVKAGIRPITKINKSDNIKYEFSNGKDAFETNNYLPLQHTK